MKRKYVGDRVRRKPKRQTRRGVEFNDLGFVRAARAGVNLFQAAVSRVGNAVIGGNYSGAARGQNAFDVQVYRDDASYVASGDRAIAIGGGNNAAEGAETIAIGHDNSAVGTGAVAIGNSNSALGEQSVAIGVSSTASQGRGVAVGSGATAIQQDALALGTSVLAAGARSVAIGTTASATNDDEAVIAALTLYQQLGGGVKKAIVRDGTAAGGDLSGTYVNPSVTWANGYSVYDARYSLTSHAHAHTALTGVTSDQHHAKSHTHNGDGSGSVDHGSLSGLSDDDHAQYALLAGRGGGQVLIGGTGGGDDLTLKSTSHATKGLVILGSSLTSAYDDVNDRLGIGTTAPECLFHVNGVGSFGDSVTAARAERALNLVSSDAVMRVWRYVSATNQAPGVELIWGDAATPSSSGNYFWDFFVYGIDGTFNIRDRTLATNNRRLVIDAKGNVCLAGATAGATTAAGNFVMKNGTAPTATLTDCFHLYAKDWAAGKAAPWFEAEDGTARAVLGVSGTQGVSTGTGTVKMNGATARNSVGWLTLHTHAGGVAYVPYWTTVTG